MPKISRPAGEHVDRGEFLGQHDRIALRQDNDPGAEPDSFGMRGDEAQRDSESINGVSAGAGEGGTCGSGRTICSPVQRLSKPAASAARAT